MERLNDLAGRICPQPLAMWHAFQRRSRHSCSKAVYLFHCVCNRAIILLARAPLIRIAGRSFYSGRIAGLFRCNLCWPNCPTP